MPLLSSNTFNRQTLNFSLIALIFLSAIRFTSLFIFQTSAVNSQTLFDLFIIGLRFDARIIATILLLFIYLPSIVFICFKNTRFFNIWTTTILSICLFIIISISFINFAYLSFFGSSIDVLIFGFLNDGTLDVLKSIFSDYSSVTIIVIALVIIFFLLKLYFQRSVKSEPLKASCPVKLIILLIIIPLMFVIARGTVSTFPLTKQEASISNNPFINSLSQNAIYHLYNAFLDHGFNSFNDSSATVLSRAGVKNIQQLKEKSGYNASNPLLQTTPKKALLANNPPHVIFVQMEGWSSQIALTDSEHTLGSFNQHRLDDYFFTNFFSNAYGTNPSIEALLLNSPITPLSQSSAYTTPFKMSNILPFKKNGYHSVFLSGGHASWRNHDKFWLIQGFDQVIGRASIAAKYGKSDNTWGVYDEYLFSYLLDDLKQQKQPSFYYVLTTNNHPPVELPDSYETPNFDLKQFNQNAQTKTMLKGFNYQSDAFGKFMTQLKNSSLKDKVIVVATGDHVLKGFDNYHAVEKAFVKYSVPAYFYVPKKYDLLKNVDLSISGSHNDLFPTLFNLALSNTQYYNFGTPLMYKSKENSFGWVQNNAFIVNNGVVNVPTKKYYLFNDDNLLLNSKAEPLLAKHTNMIKQRQYQRLLQEFLLYKDKEE